MAVIGRFNSLQVVKHTEFGLYLDGTQHGEILLPKRYVPKDQPSEVGDWLNVFIYLDSDDRLIATTQTPKVQVGGFASLTLLTKNAFLNEITRQYVVTARAKGLSERRVLYGHVFRNAMLLVVAGIPQALITVFFAGSLLIEVIFSLDGLGLLSFEAAINRDYPVVFGTLFLFTLLGLVVKLIGDLTYTLVDPRIDFENRE